MVVFLMPQTSTFSTFIRILCCFFSLYGTSPWWPIWPVGFVCHPFRSLTNDIIKPPLMIKFNSLKWIVLSWCLGSESVDKGKVRYKIPINKMERILPTVNTESPALLDFSINFNVTEEKPQTRSQKVVSEIYAHIPVFFITCVWLQWHGEYTETPPATKCSES